MTLFRSIILTGLCMAGLCGSVRAETAAPASSAINLTQAETAWLESHPDITFNYADSFEPQLIVNPDGSYSGIIPDLMNELNRRLGADIRLKAFPVAEVIGKARAGKVDGICNIHPEYADQLGMLKTGGYFKNYPALFARKHIEINAPSDMKGKTVAVIDGVYFSKKILEEHTDEISIKKVAGVLEGLQALETGTADLFLGISHNSYLITKYQLYDLSVKYIYADYPFRMAMAIRPEWPELVGIVEKGLLSFSPEELNAFVSKWVNTSIPENKGPITSTDIQFSPEERHWLSEKQMVRVHLWDHAPFMFIENGEPSGISIDYLRQVEQQTGLQFEWITEPESLATAHTMVMTGEGLDLLPATMKTASRSPHMLFTAPYLTSPIVIFMRSDAPFISDINDLKGMVVSAIRNTPLTELIKREHPDITLQEVTSADIGIQALSRASCDAYIETLAVGTYVIQSHQITNLKVAAPAPMDTRKAMFGIRKDLPELASIIDKVLATVPQEQRSRIESKYLSVKYEHGIRSTDLKKWGGILGGGTLLIILFFSVLNRELRRKVKERTAEILEKESSFRLLTNQSPVSIQIHDRQGKLLISNPAYKELYAVNDDILEELYLKYNVLEDEQARQLGIMPFIEKVFSGEDVEFPPYEYNGIDTLKTLDLNRPVSRRVWIQTRGFPLKDEAGNVTSAVFMSVDFTQQKEAQDALKLEREYSDHLIETANVMIVTLNLDGTVSNMNPMAETITGYQADELIGQNWIERLVPSRRYPNVYKDLGRLAPQHVPTFYENPILTKSGKERIISWSNSEIRQDGEVIAVTSFGMDITERRQIEHKLKESEEEFRSLIEQSPISIQVLSPDGRITKVNKAFQKLWDLGDQDLPEVLEAYNILKDDEVEKLGVMPQIKKAFTGEIVVLPIIEYDASETMKNLAIGHISSNKRWIQSRLYPVKNEAGEIINIVDMEEDMTEQKVAEIRLNEYQERLRALASELTLTEEHERRRIATELHDGAAQSLALARVKLVSVNKAVADSKATDKLDDLSRLLKESLQQIRDVLLDLSSPSLNEIGLDAALSEWLEEQAGRRQGIQTSFSNGCDEMRLGTDTLAMLFRNARELIMNSIKHAQASRISVKLHCENQVLHLEVQDDGKGFNPDKQEKRPGSDGGFGLFSVYERMADMGGVLEVESAPGQGCTSTLKIPMPHCYKGDINVDIDTAG